MAVLNDRIVRHTPNNTNLITVMAPQLAKPAHIHDTVACVLHQAGPGRAVRKDKDAGGGVVDGDVGGAGAGDDEAAFEAG